MADPGAPLWERSKENAAPLERGRNVEVLERSLQRDTSQERANKEELVRNFESLVAPSEQGKQEVDEKDDPLVNWLTYIKFHQENFPSDTHAQFLLMERCTRALVKRPRYANDVRFIRVCVTYADKTDAPSDVFSFLEQQQVGTRTALFWIAWAWVEETRKNYVQADRLYIKGVEMNAQPLKMLTKRQAQFQRRFARHQTAQAEAAALGLDEEDDNTSRRGTLAGLSEERLRRNDRSQPSSTSRRPNARQASANLATFRDRSRPTVASSSRQNNDNGASASGGFTVYNDSNNTANPSSVDQSRVHGGFDREMERDADRRKENRGRTERWNERGALKNPLYSEKMPARATSASSFEVYMDEECEADARKRKEDLKRTMERARRDRDERTLRPRTEEKVSEKLAREPMRYVRDPSKLAADRLLEDKTTHRSNKSESKPPSVSCGFALRQVKGSDGQAQCFEEARATARCYRLVDPGETNFNLLAVAKVADDVDSFMDVSDDESTQDVSMLSEGKPPAMKSVSFSCDVSEESQIHLNNLSTASSTINSREGVGAAVQHPHETTTHTKLAMKELSMMFSSPALGLNDSYIPEGNNEQQTDDDGSTADFSIVAGLVDENAANNSLLATSSQGEDYIDENSERVAPRNPEARDSGAPDFHTNALRTLEGEEEEVVVRPTNNSTAAGFEIYCDDDNTTASATASSAAPAPAALLFAIHNDENQPAAGGTAASLPGRSGLAPRSGVLQVHHDTPDSSDSHDTPNHAARESNGDTATLSVFGDFMKGADNSFAEEATREKSDVTIDLDNLSVSDNQKTGDFRDYRPHVHGSPHFGDISRIAPDTDFPSNRKRRERTVLVSKEALDYDTLHNNDIRQALRRLQVEARNMTFRGAVHPLEKDLAKMLSTKGYVDYFPKLSMPRPFLQMAPVKGTKITLGERTGLIKGELGRGSYGKVLLMETNDAEHGVIAVKAQAPTDCLALEYSILKSAEERVGRHCESNHYPYPRALSFVSLADGGILGMTTASLSGLNLVDLVNAYKASVQRSPVPELIALHYTIRMLKHVEALHWHGKILHCDVKPDNWVLTSSNCAFEGSDECMEGADLTLVDFGRAVDLVAAAKYGTDPMYVRLEGMASEEDMSCVAMRTGLCWSFDTDTFGVCASAHALLFGTHLEIEFSRTTNRWKLCKMLRRYWQKDLWQEFFDTLLNVDEASQTAIGSRPANLRDLRKRMEKHVRDHNSDLGSLLRHQAQLLPSAKSR